MSNVRVGRDGRASASTVSVPVKDNSFNEKDGWTGQTGNLPRGGNLSPSEVPYNPFIRSSVHSVPMSSVLKTKKKIGGQRLDGGTEDYLQKTVNVFLSRFLPSRSLHWATPNDSAGRERVREGARRKAMGRRAGIPDLFVLHDGLLIGIELKRPTGSVSTSDAQRDTMAALTVAGARCFVCRSLEDVQAALTECGVPLERRKDF